MRGRDKGLQFEITIARILSKWLGSSKDILWRSPGSGSVALNENKGDITPLDKRGEQLMNLISIECKFYKDLELLSLVDKPRNKSNVILNFWLQTKKGSNNKIPLLIMKRNFGKELVLTYDTLLKVLGLQSKIVLQLDNDVVGILLLDQFLTLSFDKIQNKLKAYLQRNKV